jgi:hypothetical protein
MGVTVQTKSSAIPVPATTPAPTNLLQRKCDCGGDSGVAGECEDCRKKRLAGNFSGLQTKLEVNQPGDSWEEEADRIAESVTSNGVFRTDSLKAIHQRPVVMRQTSHQGTAGIAPASVENVVGSGGSPLDVATRGFMEAHFGYDFSRVRIHNDAGASKSAKDVHALAYTVGQHIVFKSDQYNPQTREGRRLLAHELTHTLQQDSGWLRRCADPAELTTFDAGAQAIRAHPAYRALGADSRAIADEIIRLSRAKDNCMYYMDKLTLLFNTPDAPRASVAQSTSAVAAADVSEEQSRLVSPEGSRRVGIEEATSGSGRVWTRRRGQDGVFFNVDARDLNNIVVQLKVRLVARGRGTSTDVDRIRNLEDAIEKNASTNGYIVDLIFVNTGGSDVFTVGVDPSQWETSGNWVSDPLALAHETHHLLGLDDRYDYIESHADNADMIMSDRLYWFREQVRRPPDPHGEESIMGSGAHPLDDDICRVAGLDLATCTGARQARTGEIRDARMMAFGRTFSAWETLSGIRPPDPREPAGSPAGDILAQRRATTLARQIFGSDVSLDELSETVGDMRYRLSPGLQIESVPAADSRCTSDNSYTLRIPPTVRLCPQFFQQGTPERVNTLLRSAADIVLRRDGTGDTACSSSGCDTGCGDVNNGYAWAQFVNCLTGHPTTSPVAASPAPASVTP